MYNTKIKEYLDGISVHIYKKMIGADDQKEFMEEYKSDQEIAFERNRLADLEESDLPYNPFTEQREEIINWDRLVQVQEVSRKRTIQSIYDIARANYWDWFVTITFDPDQVDSFQYDDCVKLLSKWLNNARRRCPNMAYMFVPERHKSGRYHFHGIMKDCDNLGFVDSSKRTKDKQVIYNIGSYKHGFTTATKIRSLESANKYICKYVTKDVWFSTFGRKRYWCSRNLARPEVYENVYTSEQKKQLIDTITEEIKSVKTVNMPFNRMDIYEVTKNVEIKIDF